MTISELNRITRLREIQRTNDKNSKAYKDASRTISKLLTGSK